MGIQCKLDNCPLIRLYGKVAHCKAQQYDINSKGRMIETAIKNLTDKEKENIEKYILSFSKKC